MVGSRPALPSLIPHPENKEPQYFRKCGAHPQAELPSLAHPGFSSPDTYLSHSRTLIWTLYFGVGHRRHTLQLLLCSRRYSHICGYKLLLSCKNQVLQDYQLQCQLWLASSLSKTNLRDIVCILLCEIHSNSCPAPYKAWITKAKDIFLKLVLVNFRNPLVSDVTGLEFPQAHSNFTLIQYSADTKKLQLCCLQMVTCIQEARPFSFRQQDVICRLPRTLTPLRPQHILFDITLPLNTCRPTKC